VSGLGQRRGDRSFRDPEYLADLRVRQIREVAQEDRHPSLWRQFPNRGRKRRIAALKDKRHLGYLVECELARPLRADGNSKRDPSHPPLERSLTAESALVAQRLGERLLHDLARALNAARHRREHHLERAVTTPIEILQFGVETTHTH